MKSVLISADYKIMLHLLRLSLDVVFRGDGRFSGGINSGWDTGVDDEFDRPRQLSNRR